MTDSATAYVFTARAIPVGDPQISIMIRDGAWSIDNEIALYSVPGMSDDLGGELISRGWRPAGPWGQFEPGAWSVDVERA